MSVRTSKRVYSSGALEAWLHFLTYNWEARFSEDELRAGRSIYRLGHIRELELGIQDAIVHGNMADESGYAMLEWEQGLLQVRTSSDGGLFGRAIAVAGLYEIEELVAEEIPALSPDLPKVKDKEASDGNPAPSPPQKADPKPSETASPPVPKPRPLQTRFSLDEQGLVLEVHWREGGKRLRPAFGSTESEDLTDAEREMLIRLTSMARRAGFRYHTGRAGYLMDETLRMAAFVRQELRRWETYFTVVTEPGLECLGQGVRTVGLTGEALESGKDAMKLNWSLTLEGKRLTEKEGRLLLRRGGATLLPGKGIVKLSDEDTAVLAQIRHVLDNPFSGTVPRYMLFSLYGKTNQRLQLTPELRSWRDSLMVRRPGRYGDDSLPALLRDYQREGVRWMRHMLDNDCHVLLADEMGLGKTLQVLALLHSRPVDKLPHLIVCPASVVPVWTSEIRRFYPDTPVGVVSRSFNFEHDASPRVWVCSYTQLRRHKAQLDRLRLGYAVLDEAQFIKNPEAKVTQACLALHARHRIVLTGTPLENKPGDLWTLFRFLMPGLLGTRHQFDQALQQDFFGAVDLLRKQVSPFVLRRTKKQVTRELPDKVEMELICPMTDLQRQEYHRLVERGLHDLGDSLPDALQRRSLGLLTLLTRLRQVCCDPGLLPWQQCDVEHSGKLSLLIDRLQEVLDGGHKVVVFSQFVSFLERAEKIIRMNRPETTIYTLTGKTLDREKPVQGFQTNKDAAVMLVSLRAGGSGITLHAADYVFLLDPWWNPAVEAQAIDRVHRIGQEKRVFVYRMITADTVEERVRRLKLDKQSLFDQVVENQSGGLPGIREQMRSLRELIAISS